MEAKHTATQTRAASDDSADELVSVLRDVADILNMNVLTRRGLGVRQSEMLLTKVRAALAKAGASHD